MSDQKKPGETIVQRSIGEKPMIFGLSPDLIFPWAGIIIFVLIGTRLFFQSTEGWEYTIGLSLIGCLTWTSLVGKEPHKFLGKMLVPPRRLTCSYQRSHPMDGVKTRKRSKRNA
jgi:hypothetical protein